MPYNINNIMLRAHYDRESNKSWKQNSSRFSGYPGVLDSVYHCHHYYNGHFSRWIQVCRFPLIYSTICSEANSRA